MSPRRPELRRLTNLIRRRRITPPSPSPDAEVPASPLHTPPSSGIPERVPQLPAGASVTEGIRIGRITSTFHTRRLSPWELALHPNRLGETPATLDAIVIDASSALAGSVWAGWAGPAGRTMTEAVTGAIAMAQDTGTTLVFRWDLGDGSTLAPTLAAIAATATAQVAAPGSPHLGSLGSLPFGVGLPFRRRRGRGEGLGMLAPDALAGWTDPVVVEQETGHAVVASAAMIADPEALGAWFDTIRTLAIPQPAAPVGLQIAAEAAACGVTLDDGLDVGAVASDTVLDRLLAIAGTGR